MTAEPPLRRRRGTRAAVIWVNYVELADLEAWDRFRELKGAPGVLEVKVLSSKGGVIASWSHKEQP